MPPEFASQWSVSEFLTFEPKTKLSQRQSYAERNAILTVSQALCS